MTDTQKIESLKALTGETDEVLLNTFLGIAGAKVINKAYPYRSDITKVPAKYEGVQIEIAVYLYNRRGSEGEISHDEGEIRRSYESGSVPESMLRGITPCCEVL